MSRAGELHPLGFSLGKGHKMFIFLINGKGTEKLLSQFIQVGVKQKKVTICFSMVTCVLEGRCSEDKILIT